jgi:membrane protease YdiL (CAAX protease family)
MRCGDAALRETAPEGPAFRRGQWNAWGCAAIGCASFAIFVAVQTVLVVVIFFAAHPQYAHDVAQGALPPQLYADLRKASLLPSLLTPTHLAVFSVAGDGALVGATLLLAYVGLGANLRTLGLVPKASAAQLGQGLLAGIALTLMADGLGWAQSKIFGPHPQLLEKIFAARHGFESFGLDLLSVALIAPFAEELFFRGFLFAGLVQRMPLLWAAILSGALFGLAHGDLWNFLPLAGVGVALALLYHRMHTLWPNVLAHGVFNAVSLTLTYLFPQLIK